MSRGRARPRRVLGAVLASGILTSAAFAAAPEPSAPSAVEMEVGGERPHVKIGRLSRPPVLEEFLRMEPPADLAQELTRVAGFVQQFPTDGDASSQKTDAYLGFDDKFFYAIFVAFDGEPDKIRANVSRRENVFGDDIVEIQLDTFNDERRAFSFIVNPYGVQSDGIYSEGTSGGPWDFSWDAVWDSEAKITDEGYVALIKVPFRSLRFTGDGEQSWGVVLVRDIPRTQENTFWPRVSNSIQGRLNQGAVLDGLEGISPGRNLQLTPYTSGRSFSSTDPETNETERDDFDGDIGLDLKYVIKDKLTLDFTANPDFSQVESDQPQVTVNQRFEVFFPERRPFFLENATLFRTPFNLLFTRRIADPQIGARLTGKMGNYTMGALLIDDQAPGKSVEADDPLSGETAAFGILRLSREFGDQSNIGVLYTDRSIGDSFNRVLGIDGRYKFNDFWATEYHVVGSDTETVEGEQLRDTAYNLAFNRNSRNWNAHIHYEEVGPEFVTQSGFVNRTDTRNVHTRQSYRFWMDGEGPLISWEPFARIGGIYDLTGQLLDRRTEVGLDFSFRNNTDMSVRFEDGSDRLRPSSFDTLDEVTRYSRRNAGIRFNTRPIQAFNIFGGVNRGDSINFVPPDGQAPFGVDQWRADVGFTVRPTRRLSIDNTYLFTQLGDRDSELNVLVNQIARSRFNFQFNRKLSLRAIVQWDRTDVSDSLTSIDESEGINADLLVSYIIYPGTAFFVGYNSNFRNLELLNASPDLNEDGTFFNDSEQLFFKFSYRFDP